PELEVNRSVAFEGICDGTNAEIKSQENAQDIIVFQIVEMIQKDNEFDLPRFFSESLSDLVITFASYHAS
ncbi:hypothetical protein MUP59_10580, partial [Candidatus Bathyarchaeota archaeon]|nr:hypothetical protein [Candidatus Bathyarchaeota archaeon]